MNSTTVGRRPRIAWRRALRRRARGRRTRCLRTAVGPQARGRRARSQPARSQPVRTRQARAMWNQAWSDSKSAGSGRQFGVSTFGVSKLGVSQLGVRKLGIGKLGIGRLADRRRRTACGRIPYPPAGGRRVPSGQSRCGETPHRRVRCREAPRPPRTPARLAGRAASRNAAADRATRGPRPAARPFRGRPPVRAMPRSDRPRGCAATHSGMTTAKARLPVAVRSAAGPGTRRHPGRRHSRRRHPRHRRPAPATPLVSSERAGSIPCRNGGAASPVGQQEPARRTCRAGPLRPGAGFSGMRRH